MQNIQKNHIVGKKGESETWPFLEKNGYIRPSKAQRKIIKEFYLKQGKEIKGSGFDVISLDEACLIGEKELTLYEVKTTGTGRGEFIESNFVNFGFTLSENEVNNAREFGNKYKFIFVNLHKKIFRIYNLNDFFNEEVSKFYSTWSVFIKREIK